MRFLESSILGCKFLATMYDENMFSAMIIELLVAPATFLEPRCLGSGARLFALWGNPIWLLVNEDFEKRPYSLSRF